MRVLLLILLAGLVGSACEVRTEIDIAVDADGSGRVELVVAADQDAIEEEPDLLSGVHVADLEAAGWEVDGPTEGQDGWTRTVVGHDFGTPEEVATLVQEISGRDGPLRGFVLERDDAFAETRYRFRGEVDLSGGVAEVLADPELSAALGADVADLVADVGTAPGAGDAGDLDEGLDIRVAVRLPGDVETNAPDLGADGAVWTPDPAERDVTELTADSTLSRNDRAAWLVVAVVAGAAAVLVVSLRVVRWARHRSGAS